MLALDPLLDGGIGLTEVLIVVLKTLVAFGLLLVAVIMMIWFERKLISDFQNRVGPNKAGPWGLLQTLADGMKLILKEDNIPEKADRRMFILAPFLSAVPAFVTFSVIPIAGAFDGDREGAVSLFGNDTFLQLADPPVGVLLILAMSSIAVYGVMLAGWASGSKYPLLGSVRGAAQMVSYEAALGLATVAVVMLAGSLSTHEIVATQAGNGYDLFGSIPFPRWNVIATGLVPFVVFLIAGTAELNRPPFDLVEAEQELVGGFHTEYSSFRFALFYLAEFMNTVTMSAIMVTLFFGGPAGPTFDLLPHWLWGFVWFFAKLLVFLFVQVWIRATLPRFRYDQLMNLGWKALIPLSLGWVLLLGAINVGRDEDWNMAVVVSVSFAVLVAGYAGLAGAVTVAQRRRESPTEEVLA
ncbi:MAG TPA: NADH-quinone oxidoreductase subunit NuoH [Acidimicrobiales bacterium]|jgi:NADH-quinone oxidoreductase subunit H|nr:NADH-quinone oxidoreductase subunit NuoH [Acidimicrobiales bacterium]